MATRLGVTQKQGTPRTRRSFGFSSSQPEMGGTLTTPALSWSLTEPNGQPIEIGCPESILPVKRSRFIWGTVADGNFNLGKEPKSETSQNIRPKDRARLVGFIGKRAKGNPPLWRRHQKRHTCLPPPPQKGCREGNTDKPRLLFGGPRQK